MYTGGQPLVPNNNDYTYLPTHMRQLHDYYICDTSRGEYSGFEAFILPGVIFHEHEETLHHVSYEHLFQLYQRRNLDTQIMMLWTL